MSSSLKGERKPRVRCPKNVTDSELKRQAETNTKAMLEGMFDALDIRVTFVGDR